MNEEERQDKLAGEALLKATKAADKERRRKEKKARKEARREEKREAWLKLSAGGKLLFLGKRVLALAVVLGLILFGWSRIAPTLLYQYSAMVLARIDSAEVSQEQIYEEAPPDEEGAARIAALADDGKGDTWDIYIYLCGSNLESGTYNNLSDLTRYLVASENQEYEEIRASSYHAEIARYIADLNEQEMDLPDYLYLATPMSTEPDAEEAGEEAPVLYGYATANLRAMMSGVSSDKIRLILQTGGAPAWGMREINPNRSQRFQLTKDGLTELENNHIRNMGDEETLADFLSFIQSDSKADHKVLLFWNHGGAAFGFCSDEIYDGDMLSLSDLNRSLQAVFAESPDDPYFDLVGFDCCLMATAEVTDSLYGYAKYLAASEEVEPGSGWDYASLFTALSENPGMGAAAFGQAIVDSYIDFNAASNVRRKEIGVQVAAPFSLVDVTKAKAVSEAYVALISAALRDAAKDPSVLSLFGRASTQALRYGASAYDIFNSVDLGQFMEGLSERYASEAGLVADTLGEAVLYRRATRQAEGSSGLAVYFPSKIEGLAALLYYTEYLNDVCQNEDVKAFYYYKLAGCLNDELQSYLAEKGYPKAQNLDMTPLEEIAALTPEIPDNEHFRVTVPEGAEALVQDISFYLTKEEDESFIYYGEETGAGISGGLISAEFDGKWISIDGIPLEMELLSRTESTIRYRSLVELNGEEVYLMIGKDLSDASLSIQGAYAVSAEEENGLYAQRDLNLLKPGDNLRVIYTCSVPEAENEGTTGFVKQYSSLFTYRTTSKIEYRGLESGSYLAMAVLHDVRGDEYYTAPIRLVIGSRGNISEAKLADDIYVQTAVG